MLSVFKENSFHVLLYVWNICTQLCSWRRCDYWYEPAGALVIMATAWTEVPLFTSSEQNVWNMKKELYRGACLVVEQTAEGTLTSQDSVTYKQVRTSCWSLPSTVFILLLVNHLCFRLLQLADQWLHELSYDLGVCRRVFVWLHTCECKHTCIAVGKLNSAYSSCKAIRLRPPTTNTHTSLNKDHAQSVLMVEWLILDTDTWLT